MFDISFKGKVVLVTGVANNRSIAYGIAQAYNMLGATVIVVCQSERLIEGVRSMFQGDTRVVACDLTSPSELESLVAELPDKIDVVVHSVANAPLEMLDGSPLKSFSPEGFSVAMITSVASFMMLVKAVESRLHEQSSIIAMTYLGAERAFQNYNIMGPAKAALNAAVRMIALELGPRSVRCNAIAAGPMRTLASKGIKSSQKLLALHEKVCPLRRSMTWQDISGTAVYLGSALSSGVTGQVIDVDNGYSILGVTALEE